MPYKDPNDPRAKEARRKHYYANKEAYLKRSKNQRKEMLDYIRALKDRPCMDCGVSYPPYVMDFDHRDPSTKVAEIKTVASRGCWQKLLDEIAKCDIVCSNCHRIRTFRGKV